MKICQFNFVSICMIGHEEEDLKAKIISWKV